MSHEFGNILEHIWVYPKFEKSRDTNIFQQYQDPLSVQACGAHKDITNMKLLSFFKPRAILRLEKICCCKGERTKGNLGIEFHLPEEREDGVQILLLYLHVQSMFSNIERCGN